MSSTTTIFTKGDAGRRYLMLSGYDKRVRERSRKSYLTFEAVDDNTTITLTSTSGTEKAFYVSTDNGASWTQKISSTSGTALATINAGKRMLIKGSHTSSTSFSGNVFSSDKGVYLFGNILSLIYGDNFQGQTVYTAAHGMRGLFKNMTTLLTDRNKGYIVVPILSLPNFCLYEAFYGCSAMKVAPIIEATTLGGDSCCKYICAYCTSLKYVPDFVCTSVGGSGLYGAFAGCTSLRKPPRLPAKEVGNQGYCSIYSGCTALVEAPELPATIIGTYCYTGAFQGCSSLKKGPSILPATELKEACYQQMFYQCGLLEEAPILPAHVLVTSCYGQMFRFCYKIEKVVCLATDISATNCTQYWFLNTNSTGTFVKNPFMTSWLTGASGIPSGWTVQDYPYIMTDWSNPEAMRVMYAKGFAASPEHMTKTEAEAVTNIKQLFAENTKVLSFDELRFFTSVNENQVTNSTMSVLYWASKCVYATIPNNWTKVGNACVGGGSKRYRIIYGPNVTDILNYNFYSIGNSTTPCNVICLASTPPTITGQNQGSLSNDAIVIYVPDNSVSAYQADSVWGQSTHILPISQCPADLLVYHDLLGGSLDITPYTT